MIARKWGTVVKVKVEECGLGDRRGVLDANQVSWRHSNGVVPMGIHEWGGACGRQGMSWDDNAPTSGSGL